MFLLLLAVASSPRCGLGGRDRVGVSLPQSDRARLINQLTVTHTLILVARATPAVLEATNLPSPCQEALCTKLHLYVTAFLPERVWWPTLLTPTSQLPFSDLRRKKIIAGHSLLKRPPLNPLSLTLLPDDEICNMFELTNKK